MVATNLADLTRQVGDRSLPFVTYYDLATGERTELSATTLGNWVAKTANFLTDEADAAPGSRVRIGLPTHWLRIVWLLSAWTVGAAIVDQSADIGISGPELAGNEDLLAASALRPFGLPFAEPPAGFIDLGSAVPGHGDVFIGLDEPTPQTLALDLDGVQLDHAGLLAAAPPDDRRLLVQPGSMARDAELAVVAATGGGSLVLVAGGSPADATRVAEQEHAHQ